MARGSGSSSGSGSRSGCGSRSGRGGGWGTERPWLDIGGRGTWGFPDDRGDVSGGLGTASRWRCGAAHGVKEVNRLRRLGYGCGACSMEILASRVPLTRKASSQRDEFPPRLLCFVLKESRLVAYACILSMRSYILTIVGAPVRVPLCDTTRKASSQRDEFPPRLLCFVLKESRLVAYACILSMRSHILTIVGAPVRVPHCDTGCAQ